MRPFSPLSHPCHPFRPIFQTWVENREIVIVGKLETPRVTRAGVTP